MLFNFIRNYRNEKYEIWALDTLQKKIKITLKELRQASHTGRSKTADGKMARGSCTS